MKRISKKTLALVIAAVVLLSSVATVVAAALLSIPGVTSAAPVSDKVLINGTVTINVKTSTQVTRIRIANADGSTYALANTANGFNRYVDSGADRIWSIDKPVQALGKVTKTVYAGTYLGYSTAKASVTFTAYKNQKELDDAISGGSGSTTTAGGGSTTTTTTTGGSTTTTTTAGEKIDPPYPFWQDYKNYATPNTYVYYKGKIYYNQWYMSAGIEPTSSDPANCRVLVGDAEWTVPESDDNYKKPSAESEINRILTDAEVNTLFGGINPEYSPEASANRLDELIPKSYYEELFPYRFGSPLWKANPATKAYYPNPDELPDYYSYENLKEAVHRLAGTIIKVEWYEGAEWCYRIIRLDKATKEQMLVYSDKEFGADYLESTKEHCTSICDYGSFLATGDLNTRKRELAGFLANISHETGGGSVDGQVSDNLTGLYFNEEVGFIGSDAIGYVQNGGTNYLPVAGKSYHGRGGIQLSYNYNYGLCSDVLFGDSSILLNDPDMLERDGILGLMTGIWFWMTPQPPKPSCHQVITGIWQPKPGAPNESYNGNFGLTIIIINNEAGQSETGAGAVARRARYFRLFAAKMGADITGEHCDTVGMTTFTQTPAAS